MDAVFDIEVDGKVVASYCHKCRRFTRGNKRHSTKEHGGKPKAAMMARATVSPPSVPTSVEYCQPVATPRSAPPSYDFGAMPTLQRSGHFLAADVTASETGNASGDDESVVSVDNNLLASLNAQCPKGQGRPV